MDSNTCNEIEEVPENEKSEIVEYGGSKVNVTDEIREVLEKSEIKEGGGKKVKVANEIEEASITEKVEIQEDGSLKVVATSSATPKNVLGKSPRKDMIFRADQIDLKSLDIQLEKHLSRAWSRNVDPKKPREVWEIDLSKLQIKDLVARGTYGTIYRGTYDNLDVAGMPPPMITY